MLPWDRNIERSGFLVAVLQGLLRYTLTGWNLCRTQHFVMVERCIGAKIFGIELRTDDDTHNISVIITRGSWRPRIVCVLRNVIIQTVAFIDRFLDQDGDCGVDLDQTEACCPVP